MSMPIGTPIIRRLIIDRFRGIKHLDWLPTAGVNVILGGGDVGKTTILDAIALLLTPTNSIVLSDADYWQRDVENEFCIEAVMSLPDASGINQQARNAWPWEWDGDGAKLPEKDKDSAAADAAITVYRLRIRGTPDFDAAFEVLQPDDTTDHFSVAVRRKIGLVRLSGDDRNDRDLRLVQGSALDRLLSDKTLRARLSQRLGESDVEKELNSGAQSQMEALSKTFKEHALPSGLGLGLTGGQGLSFNALIGLTATQNKVKLPLSSWGAGTRRLAALDVAAACQGEYPITLVDEIERGLEPYRQRVLVDSLRNKGSQVFVTTHSAMALSAASGDSIWYVDSTGSIGRLPANISQHVSKDPETFLARISIIAEGLTEVGFVTRLLEKAIGGDLLRHGIWVTDAGGNDNALKLLEGLSGSGLIFAGFVDDEGRDPQKWKTLKDHLGNLLFQWPTGCLEENIISLIPVDQLEQFIQDADGDSGIRLRTLADRLGLEDKAFSSIKAKASNLTQLIIEAATGKVPNTKQNADKWEKKAFKKHSESWFKSREGGHELAGKVFNLGLWPKLEGHLLPFLNAVRLAVKLPEISTLQP